MFIEVLYPETQKALDKLKSLTFLKDFYMAGGTALALQLGHRRSIDLDFFSKKGFEAENLLQALSSQASFSVITKKKDTLTGHWLDTRLEFFKYPYILIEPSKKWQSVNIASVKDIGLMKLTAVSDRGSKKDFFDLYEICRETIDLEELFSLLPKKFADVNYSKYHLLKSLVFFEDAEKEPDPDLFKSISWSEVKNYFIEKTKTIKL